MEVMGSMEVHQPGLPMDGCTLKSPEDFKECTLYLSTLSRQVGKGVCFIDSSATLHNRPLPIHHCKVRVDFATEEDAPLAILLERANIMTVGQAIGTYVAWTVKLIKPIKSKTNDKEKGKGK